MTVPMHETETATVIVTVGVGSRYETDSEAGISHFIEHMLFKGTIKRPTFMEITAEVDAFGGEINAYTSKDRTAFYIKADSKHLGQSLDVLADIYLNSKIDEGELNKEKGAIVQEIAMYEDTPMSNVGNVFEKLLYPKVALGRDVLGSQKTVKSLTRQKIVAYRDRNYAASDTVICVTGKFNEKKTIAEIRQLFGGMRRGRTPKLKKVKEIQARPQVSLAYKKTDQTHLVLGVRSFHHNHPDRFALGLLSVILGGNMSSRLFAEVREKRGLAYYVRTGVENFHDCGYLAAQAGVNHDKVVETIQVILAEYHRMATEKVTEAELRKAKEFIKGHTVMGLESSDEVASFFIGQEVLKKKIMTADEMFQKIERVKLEDVLRVADKIFLTKHLNLAIIGPWKDESIFKRILQL